MKLFLIVLVLFNLPNVYADTTQIKAFYKQITHSLARLKKLTRPTFLICTR